MTSTTGSTAHAHAHYFGSMLARTARSHLKELLCFTIMQFVEPEHYSTLSASVS